MEVFQLRGHGNETQESYELHDSSARVSVLLTILYGHLRMWMSMLQRSSGSYSALTVIISRTVLFIIYNISLSKDTVTGYKLLRATY